MALFKNWKPKTIFGKVVKGTTIAVGAGAVLATGVGAVAGAIGGGGLLAGAISGIGTAAKVVGKAGTGVKTVLSKVGAGAAKLITGQSKEERVILREVKDEAREAVDKKKFIDKLISAGATEKQAYEKANVQYDAGGDIKENSGTDFLSKLRDSFKTDPVTGDKVVKSGVSGDKSQSWIWIAAAAVLGLAVIKK